MWKKGGSPRGGDAGKNLQVKGTLRSFLTEHAQDKMLVSDPNLEREMTVHQGLRKRFTPHYKIYNEKASGAFQTILDKFFLQRKHSNSQCL